MTLLADRLLIGEWTFPADWNTEKLIKDLRQAQRFKVQFDPADIVAELRGPEDARTQFLRQHLKLPYSLCWFEWEPVPGGGIEGCLCSDDNDVILITYFYCDSVGDLEHLGGVRFCSSLDDWGGIKVDDEYGDKSIQDMTPQEQTAFANLAIIVIQRTHWVIALVNSKNIVDRRQVTVKQPITRKRIKSKLPLYSHHIVQIKPSISASFSHAKNSANSKQVRAHLVRGHFKIRKSGAYWWNSFARGNANAGIVTHDYECLAPEPNARTS